MRTRTSALKKALLVSFMLALACQPAECAESGGSWVTMPAGARPTYMGIHGGTMPVSLLVSSDGTSLLTFVGRTGNDFLEVLHHGDIRLPSLLGSTARNATSMSGSKTARGNADDDKSQAVIYVGASDANLQDPPQPLLPFGFSPKPAVIEGALAKPSKRSPLHKTFRLFFQPEYLRPR
ncbi:MAG: hypothetical protein J5838_01145 [Desulfovibrio sp.]|nr:hypothetical protein [Desulfovibrio sp.]